MTLDFELLLFRYFIQCTLFQLHLGHCANQDLTSIWVIVASTSSYS